MRWWQRLVATRLLEVDADGRLVWETMVLTMAAAARQVVAAAGAAAVADPSGRAVRGAAGRAAHRQGPGGLQGGAAAGADLGEGAADEYKVREVNGQEEIELLDGRRRGGCSGRRRRCTATRVSSAAADEAWKVRAAAIEEGLTPTMVEREQPQLLLVSTAHRLATALMLGRRQVGAGRARGRRRGPADRVVGAAGRASSTTWTAWRQASPHWTPRRETADRASSCEALAAARSPIRRSPTRRQSFRAQWLNQWPARQVEPPAATTRTLLPAGRVGRRWPSPGSTVDGPVWVAVEDDYGLGAAVAAVGRLEDGRLEVDGWLCDDWDTAIARRRAARRARPRSASCTSARRCSTGCRRGCCRRPRPAVHAQTRAGLALLRDLAAGRAARPRRDTDELDAGVRGRAGPGVPDGAVLIAQGPTHLVKAAAWALRRRTSRRRIPAVH